MAEHCPWCGCSSMVEQQPSKLMTRVRFPSPAPIKSRTSTKRPSQKMSREGTGKVARATKHETQQAPAAVAARGLPWAIEAAGLMPRRRFARRLLLGEAQRGLEASQAGQAVVHLAVGQGDERLILLLEVGD